jgi:hypothetical protein
MARISLSRQLRTLTKVVRHAASTGNMGGGLWLLSDREVSPKLLALGPVDDKGRYLTDAASCRATRKAEPARETVAGFLVCIGDTVVTPPDLQCRFWSRLPDLNG